MPAPYLAHRSIAICLAMNLMGALFFCDASLASNEPRRFDIQEQPLPAALVAFAEQTGMATLFDAKLTDGKRSTRVRGRLGAQDALRILLAGTDLSFRQIGDTAFAVGPNTSTPVDDDRPDKARRGEFEQYFARIQTQLEQSICGQTYMRSAAYRAVMQLWIGAGGAIDAIHPVSAGDDDRQAMIVAAVVRTRVAAPPVGLPQPVTVILQRGETDAACRNRLVAR